MKRGRFYYDQDRPLKAFDFVVDMVGNNDEANAFLECVPPRYNETVLGGSSLFVVPLGPQISVYRITGEIRIDDNTAEAINVSDHDVQGAFALIVDHQHPPDLNFERPPWFQVFHNFTNGGHYGAYDYTSNEINLRYSERFEVLHFEKLLVGTTAEFFSTKMPFSATDNYDQSAENYCGFFNWRRPIYSPVQGNGDIPEDDPLFEPWRHPASKMIKRINAEPINFGMPGEIVRQEIAKGPLRYPQNDGTSVSEVGFVVEMPGARTAEWDERLKHVVGIRHPNTVETGGTLGGFKVEDRYEIPSPYIPLDPVQNVGHFDGQLFGVATIGNSRHIIERDRMWFVQDQVQLAPPVTHVENAIHKQGLGFKMEAEYYPSSVRRLVGHEDTFKDIDIDCSENPIVLKLLQDKDPAQNINIYTPRIWAGLITNGTAGRYQDGMLLRVRLRFWYRDIE